MGSGAQVDELVFSRRKDTSLILTIGREDEAVWTQVHLEVWQEVKVVFFFSGGFNFLCDVFKNWPCMGASRGRVDALRG